MVLLVQPTNHSKYKLESVGHFSIIYGCYVKQTHGQTNRPIVQTRNLTSKNRPKFT